MSKIGNAVIGGFLASLIGAHVSAAEIQAANADRLSAAIVALEKGDGQSAVAGLTAMLADGDAEAGYLLGSVWHKGTGVRRDFAKARDAYAAASFLGHPAAMNALGLLYRDGLGVAADPVEAVAWFRVAAEYNQADAMTNRDSLETELSDRQKAAGRALALRRETEIDLVSRDKLGSPPKLPVRSVQDANTRAIALAMLRRDENAADLNAPEDTSTKASLDQAPSAAPAGTTPETPVAAESFVVQIGVFAKAESIQRIRKQAEDLGLPVQETPREVEGKTATRLTAGPFLSEKAANQASERLNTALKVTTKVMPAES